MCPPEQIRGPEMLHSGRSGTAGGHGFSVHESMRYVLTRTTDKMRLYIDRLTDVTRGWQGPNSVFQRFGIHNIVPLASYEQNDGEP